MQASFIKYKIDNIHTVTYECHKSNVVGHLLRLHATQKALQLPLSSSFSFFYSKSGWTEQSYLSSFLQVLS